MYQSMDYQVAIVGGGLVGPLLGTALATSGLSVVVIDAMPETARRAKGFDGRAYSLSAGSISALEALGIWDAVVAKAQPILDIRVGDGEPGSGAGPFDLHFDHAELDGGPMGHMLEDRFLRPALLDALSKSGADQLTGRAVDSVEAGLVTFADGTSIKAALVVGCDGRNSRVAASAGIDRHGWPYAQTSLVSAVEHEAPHNGTAWQLFSSSGPLAVLPLPGNRSSIVWTETKERAAIIADLNDSDYLKELQPVFGEFLGTIKPVGQRYTYPIGLSLASRLVGDRLALAGDSAHGIHPLAGQGLNLGIRDVAALAETLVNAMRLGRDIGAPDVLDEYARWRRFDIAAMAGATDGINRLFSNSDLIAKTIRGVGIAAIGSFPTLKRNIMRHAAGLAGERPRLLRGLSL